MKAVLLTNGHGNQRALANKLSRVVDLAAIVISENVPRRKKPFRERSGLFLRRIEGRLVGRLFARTWFELLDRYDTMFPRLPCTRVLRVTNVNDRETLSLLDAEAPDVVLVSGTNLVGKGILERGKRAHGVLNLHTGISPYVKGGPNCTNWCLSKGWFHLIGSTVMWIDLGVDTGDIIFTDRTALDGTESLTELHYKVTEHAHDMYVRSVSCLASGKDLPRIRQGSIAEGTTFYTREWNASAMLRAHYNFRQHYRNAFTSNRMASDARALQLVQIPEH